MLSCSPLCAGKAGSQSGLDEAKKAQKRADKTLQQANDVSSQARQEARSALEEAEKAQKHADEAWQQAERVGSQADEQLQQEVSKVQRTLGERLHLGKAEE
ncbi:g7242 [Coccomyxa viridis]|uniref:G7242 protein n=1 Tax=Coccomyxa viridis TaxID=1274662 RepID=A0ABP1FXD0_9CHLO